MARSAARTNPKNHIKVTFVNCPMISIIILNWNGWKDTLECLESLKNINYNNYTIILVDNGSTDDSLWNIENYLEKWRKINSQKKNYFH
jgi:GT2 family glycosyltransferase